MSAIPPVVIDQDIACVQCGYNLRGLAGDGRCPECNADVQTSARGDFLRYADPTWLARVKLGADLMYWGIAVGIVVGLCGGALMAAVGGRRPGAFPAITLLFSVIGPAFHAVAVFLLTTQEPRITFTEAGFTWRRFVRVCAVASIACQALTAIPWVVSFAPILVLLMIAGGVCGVATMYGEFSYAHGFALRIPDAKLARSTQIVKWGLSSVALAAALLSVGMIVAMGILPGTPGSMPAGAPPGGRPSVMILFGIVGAVCGIGYLIFGLWACRLLWRYRKAFKAALALARGGDAAAA